MLFSSAQSPHFLTVNGRLLEAQVRSGALICCVRPLVLACRVCGARMQTIDSRDDLQDVLQRISNLNRKPLPPGTLAADSCGDSNKQKGGRAAFALLTCLHFAYAVGTELERAAQALY